jgi:adenylate kinase
VQDLAQEATHFVGEAHNYGLTREEIAEIEMQEKEKQKQEQERLDQERRAREEKEAGERAARDKLLQEDLDRIEEIKRQERQMLEIKSEPLRQYLMKNVIPPLTKGLIEVCQMQPDDPIDFLAEYLFRYK